MNQLLGLMEEAKQIVLEFMDEFWENIASIDSAVSILSIIGTAVGAYFIFVRKLIRYRRAPRKEYYKVVDQNYGHENRVLLKKFYVETRGQDVDPCYNDEIREDNGVFFSVPLIPFFINTAFSSTDQARYYLVLADSGMGKSTFLLRLYHDYIFRSSHKRHNIKLVPLSKANCIDAIINIEAKEDTILLLDALDENADAMNDFETFFEKLLTVTEDYFCVIITCRTQFFPNANAEPNVTGRIKSGVGNKSENIVKKYISPFSDKQVHEYLRKRYRHKRCARRQALDIINKTPSLMARPIILNWVDFLQGAPEQCVYAYQIYGEIINIWIQREDYNNKGAKLFALSLEIADYMFQNKTTSIPAATVDAIAMRDSIVLSPIVAKSRSLLNRNGNGEYKFAHRSFLEYFMAYSVFQNMTFCHDQKFFLDSSNARMFLMEMLVDEFMKHSDQVNTMCQVLGALAAGKKESPPVDEEYVRSFLSTEMQIRSKTNTSCLSLGFSQPHLRVLNSLYDGSDLFIEFTHSDNKIVIAIKIVKQIKIDPKGGQYIGELTSDEIMFFASHLSDFSKEMTESS